jgi:hypothetical protein
MSSTKTTRTSNKVRSDPRFERAAYDVYGQANETAAGFSPIELPNLPGLTDDQLAAQSGYRGVANRPSAVPGLQGALNPLLNFQPQQITGSSVGAPDLGAAASYGGAAANASLVNRGDIRDVSADPAAAAQFSGEGLRDRLAEFDPSYQDRVIDLFMRDNDAQRTLAEQGLNARHAAQGAFGSTGAELGVREQGRAFADVGARHAAGLRLAGFNTALGTLENDYARTQQANLFNADQALRAQGLNQGADQFTAGTNAQLGTQASISTADNQTSAGIATAQGANRFAISQAQLAQAAAVANQRQSFLTQSENVDNSFRSADLTRDTAYDLARLDTLDRGNQIQNADLLGSIGQQNRDLLLQQQQVDAQNALAAQQAPLTQLAIRQSGLTGLPQGQDFTGYQRETRPFDYASLAGGGLGAVGSIYAGTG